MDRLWLRCAVVIACAMGVALLAVGIATYLMAAGHDTSSWAAYVVAGLVTLAMPAIPWIYLRQLRELLVRLRASRRLVVPVRAVAVR